MLVDLSPLLRGASADVIRVAGVTVGDEAASVDRRALTGADAWSSGGSLSHANDTVSRTIDGVRVEVPLAERVDATVRFGGFLRSGDVALRVADGTIETIFVRGPSLAELAITNEAQITRAFGPATGHERKLGCRVHHYSDRRFAVGWHDKQARLEHVQLGAPPWQEPRLGAPALLGELLTGFPLFEGSDWAEPAGGSAQVRHRRIAALARALDLGSPADLVQGSFLQRRAADGPGGSPRAIDDGRRRVLEELAALGPRHDRPIHDRTMRWVFRSLLHYRRDAERVVRATSGWLECSDPALLGMIFTQNHIADKVSVLMTDVDRWLCALMDPASRTFELRDLVADHGYPDVDLHELEMD